MATEGTDLELPPGNINRMYLLAASADGDQKATFKWAVTTLS